jgi:hypothetical protein
MKRIAMWSLALLKWCVLPTVVLAVAVAGVLWVYSLFFNHRPPQIAQGVVFTNDPRSYEDVSARLSTVLQQTFPVGTGEAALKSTLLRQGFRPLPPPPPNCLKPGESPRVGAVYVDCYDPTHELRYDWGDGAVCGNTISVVWTTDGNGGLKDVRGFYHSACL